MSVWHKHPHVRTGSELTLGERAADKMRNGMGSWAFIFSFIGCMIIWAGVNTLFIGRVLHHQAFDPYPYILLNLCLSCLAAVQGIILQISANRGDRISAEVALHTQGNTDKLIAHGDQLYAINQQQLEILELLHNPDHPVQGQPSGG